VDCLKNPQEALVIDERRIALSFMSGIFLEVQLCQLVFQLSGQSE